MSPDSLAKGSLRKRLLPLYIAIFMQGFVFWYATEKLFMTTIGFNGTSIGLMVALYSAVIVLTETPSGILADRWSRKGVAILAGIALAISGLISGLSNSVPIFLIGTCFWGVYFALYSGTYDSMIYDTVLEETGKPEKFQQHLGTMHFFDGSALILGSLVGGFVAQHIGLRDTYLYTIPFALLSTVALLLFREPQLHKSVVDSPIRQHIQETLAAVFKRSSLFAILAVLIIMSVVNFTILEFDQLWLIALGMSVLLYGPVNAIVLAGYGLGGAIGGRLGLHRIHVLLLTLVATLLSALGLALSHNVITIVVCVTVMIFALTAITIAFTKRLHDALSSNIRAGATSAVSSLGRITIIPVVLLFGYASQKTSIFQAAWILIVLLLIASIFAFKSYKAKKTA